MSFSSWRQFQFYESQQIHDPLSESTHPLFSDHSLSAIASLRISNDPEEPDSKTYSQSDLLVLSYNSVHIKLVSLTNSKIVYDFQAYSETDTYHITHIKCIPTLPSIFLTVAECSGKPALVKVWKFGDHLRNPDSFISLIEIKDKEHENHYPISALDISSNLSCIAVGYTNGAVVLIRGDILRDRGYKQRVIYSDSKNEPITSLELNNLASTLFVSTTSRIFTLLTTGRNNREVELVLNDNEGVLLNCGTKDGKSRFACLSQQSLDAYTEMGEKKSLALDVENKSRLFYIDPMHYLIVTSIDSSSYKAKKFADVTNYKLNIVDIENRLVSMSSVVTASIVDVLRFDTNGALSILVVLGDGRLLRITEKKLEDQLNIVIQRELYQIALQLAEQHSTQLKANQLFEIKKMYGDYLYKKNEKTLAMDQYIQSLAVIEETSEIISKYSIAQGGSADSINNLSRFLWALLKSGNAYSDHVTLLIITLIKLKDQEKINYFLEHYSRVGAFVEKADEYTYNAEDDEEYFYSDVELFDLTKILNLLVEAGFGEEAYKLSRKFSKEPSTTVNILLNTLKDPVRALNYTKSLPIDDTLRVLLLYSKTLLDSLPNDVNELLIHVFTGVYKPELYSIGKTPTDQRETENFNDMVFHTYTSFFQYKSSIDKNEQKRLSASEPTYHPPRPSLIFTSFINKPYEFVVFLEACLEAYNKFKGFENDKQDVFTKLYDIYLVLSEEDDAVERRKGWKEKATKVYQDVETSGNFDPENSLMVLISDLHSFSIEKKENNKADIISEFRLLTLNQRTKAALEYLQQHGERCPELYPMSLKHCISAKNIIEDVGGEDTLKEKVVKPILDLGIMDMLEVVQLLGTSNTTSFGLIKEVLINHIEEETQTIETNQKLLDSYNKELDKVNEELHILLSDSAPMEVKLNRESCKICQTLLELPVVYFKCGHAYHQKCLNEEDLATSKEGKTLYKCPQCIVELETANKLVSDQAEVAQKQNEQFEMALNLYDTSNSDIVDSFTSQGDKFNIVFDFISKGALESSHNSIV